VPNWRFTIPEYRAYSNLKLQKFKKLITKGEVEFLTDKWDSDNDLADYNF